MKHSDLQHCNSDLAAPMKRSLQLRSGLLLLLLAAACTILCFRAAVRRADIPLLEAAVGMPSASFNATLLRLASVDVGAEDLRKDLEQLLNDRLAAGDPLHRTFASWRRFNHHSDNHLRSPLWRRPNSGARLLRSPRDDPLLPEFRRLARDWLGRRRSHPDAVPPLLDLVKRPLDLHRDPSALAPTRRYASCAVVGNSGILLQSNRGDLIDAHDLVIRLNNARTQGYERNVGSRTGLAFINSNILHLCARREACPCHPYGDGVPIAMYVCQAAHLLDYAACNASHRAPLLVTDPRFDRLCARIVKYYSLRRFAAEAGRAAEEWDQAHDAKLFHYSSGMQAVVLALGVCDRVGVFGFGKSAAAKHHYHTNQKAELSLHDYEAEYAFYGDLADRPEVIPFLADAGIRVPPVVLYH